jgi:hypothetical protein
MSPLRDNFFNAEQVDSIELYFLLNAFVCGECFLVQLKEYVSPEQTRGQKWSAARRSAWRVLSFLSSRATCMRLRSRAPENHPTGSKTGFDPEVMPTGALGT